MLGPGLTEANIVNGRANTFYTLYIARAKPRVICPSFASTIPVLHLVGGVNYLEVGVVCRPDVGNYISR